MGKQHYRALGNVNDRCQKRKFVMCAVWNGIYYDDNCGAGLG